jgi:hypothetical protein
MRGFGIPVALCLPERFVNIPADNSPLAAKGGLGAIGYRSVKHSFTLFSAGKLKQVSTRHSKGV